MSDYHTFGYRGWVGYCWAPTQGVFWLAIRSWRLVLRAPWSHPMFSERYGFKRAFMRLRGWRLFAHFVTPLEPPPNNWRR